MSKVYKMWRKRGINMNVFLVKRQELEHVLNVKTLNVKNIFILNVQEKRKYICNNFTYKKLSI